MKYFLIPFLFMTALGLVDCRKTAADSDYVLAALGAGAINRSRGATANSGATGAMAALSAVGSGLSTGASAWLPPAQRGPAMMLAMLGSLRFGKHAAQHRTLARVRPNVFPAAFLCNGGDCATVGASGSFTMTGTETCEDKNGTVTANSINVSLVNDGDTITYTTSGQNKFNYANGCGTYSVDFENYPDYKLVRLSGSINSVGTIASTLMGTGNSESGFVFAHTQITTVASDNFTVDGGTPLVMSIRVDETTTENLLYDSNTDEISNGVATGQISMNGTINGQDIDLSTNYFQNLP